MAKWFFAFITAALAALVLLIWIDQSSSDGAEPDDPIDVSENSFTAEQSTGAEPDAENLEFHHEPKEETDETYFDFHAGVDFNDPEAIRNRIDTLESALIDMGDESARMTRAAIPYYGELILLYNRLGRFDGAAEASRHIAMIADDADDWWNAAAYFRNWARESQQEERYYHYMNRSLEAYESALVLSDDAELRSDYAITLLSLDKEDEALAVFEQLIEENTNLFRPYLYAGVILHEKGKKIESIAYIRRSVEKAETGAEEEEINSFVQQNSIEI